MGGELKRSAGWKDADGGGPAWTLGRKGLPTISGEKRRFSAPEPQYLTQGRRDFLSKTICTGMKRWSTY